MGFKDYSEVDSNTINNFYKYIISIGGWFI